MTNDKVELSDPMSQRYNELPGPPPTQYKNLYTEGMVWPHFNVVMKRWTGLPQRYYVEGFSHLDILVLVVRTIRQISFSWVTEL